MYGYKCEICECSLDPGEGRVCDDCRDKMERLKPDAVKIKYTHQDREKCYAS